MKLSKSVEYAFRALLQLATSDGSKPIPCRRLAQLGRIPERFLLQILRSMVTRGILRSTRGAEGGYTLAKPAAAISLLEVIESIEGPLEPQLAKGDLLNDPGIAILRGALQRLVASQRVRLDAVSLTDLLPRPRAADKQPVPEPHLPMAGKVFPVDECLAPANS